MPDLSLGQIEDDVNYNFQSKYDEDKVIYDGNSHSCKYFEMSEFNTKFSSIKAKFSIYSHNVRSLNGHWDNFLDIINSAQPTKFQSLHFKKYGVYKNTMHWKAMENLNMLHEIKMDPLTPIVVVVLVFLLTQIIKIMRF